jgi:hypothetical protein
MVNVCHLKKLNSFILFHGTGWSYTILHTVKMCSIAFVAKVSVEWWGLYTYSSSWNSLWLPAWGSSCSSWVLINQISFKLALVLCEAMALAHVSDKYKVISESFQSVMNCISTSVTHHDVPFRVVPFRVYAVALAFLPVLQALLLLTWNHIYGQWLVLNFRDIQLWGAFLSVHRGRWQQNKSCKSELSGYTTVFLAAWNCCCEQPMHKTSHRYTACLSPAIEFVGFFLIGEVWPECLHSVTKIFLCLNWENGPEVCELPMTLLLKGIWLFHALQLQFCLCGAKG